MKKQVGWIGAGLVGAVLLAPLVAPSYTPWSGVDKFTSYINIKTGKSRFVRSLWFIQTSEKIDDTPVSIALDGERVDVADIEEWHPVSTYSPGGDDPPRHRFHSAFYQASQILLIQRLRNLNPAGKLAIARGLLETWQKTGGDEGGRIYIESLLESDRPERSKEGGQSQSR
ncbi:MAG: hypothetical protein QF752_17420 [Planctomycetota bacterium]|jgi:hypothetical protein|nr:hypothetical protein [Planctomycetota bacterium]